MKQEKDNGTSLAGDVPEKKEIPIYPLLVLSEGKVRWLHQQNELNETLSLN